MLGSYVYGISSLSAAKIINVGKAGEKSVCLGHKPAQFRCLLSGILVCNMDVLISYVERQVTWMDTCIQSDETDVFNLN